MKVRLTRVKEEFETQLMKRLTSAIRSIAGQGDEQKQIASDGFVEFQTCINIHVKCSNRNAFEITGSCVSNRISICTIRAMCRIQTY